MISDENIEVNVEEIGGAPELGGLAVIVTTPAAVAVLLGCAVVWDGGAGAALDCGVALEGVGWVVEVVGVVVGGLLDG